MARLTDNDRHLGRFITYARSSWNPWRLVYSSGGGADGDAFNHVTAYAFGWVVRVKMPRLLRPWRQWVATGHYEWAKSPDAGYWDEEPREYGFSLHEGFLQLFLGPQTNDSTTTKSWCCHLPWTQWRFVRFTLYDVDGHEFWTQYEAQRKKGGAHWDEQHAFTKAVPKAVFEFTDFDGKVIQATTHIEEREWRFGEKWCSWLSVFRAPRIRRSLDIEFSKEVGPEKGSWKGGTLGHGIEMLPGESAESAFRRYCQQEHTSKYQRFYITFLGRVQ
jgi:hypothetical protein